MGGYRTIPIASGHRVDVEGPTPFPQRVRTRWIFPEISGHPFASLGECTYEQGGYFIINGSEKVIIAQERQAENKMYCFRNTRNTKYSHIVEVRSVSRDRIASPKTLNVKITSKEGLIGKRLYIGCTKFKQDLPLCIVFRALGIESDRDIVERILYDVEDAKKAPLLQLLQPSLEESSTILTQHCALEFMAKRRCKSTTSSRNSASTTTSASRWSTTRSCTS
jgi:DNA-directed RNA polymerase II subunit RPB2